MFRVKSPAGRCVWPCRRCDCCSRVAVQTAINTAVRDTSCWFRQAVGSRGVEGLCKMLLGSHCPAHHSQHSPTACGSLSLSLPPHPLSTGRTIMSCHTTRRSLAWALPTLLVPCSAATPPPAASAGVPSTTAQVCRRAGRQHVVVVAAAAGVRFALCAYHSRHAE